MTAKKTKHQKLAGKNAAAKNIGALSIIALQHDLAPGYKLPIIVIHPTRH